MLCLKLLFKGSGMRQANRPEGSVSNDLTKANNKIQCTNMQAVSLGPSDIDSYTASDHVHVFRSDL